MAKYKVKMNTELEFVIECNDKFQLKEYLALNDVRTMMNNIEDKGGLVYSTETNYSIANSKEDADISIKTE